MEGKGDPRGFIESMKFPLCFLALVSALFPVLGMQAASTRPSIAIHVSVSPATSVPDGTTVTVIASTSHPVSNIWVFAGSSLDIINVLYVASCDAPPNGGYTRCSGHARHMRGVINLPDPPYRQSKKSGNTQTFFACWNSVTPANCSKPVKVTWRKATARKHLFRI